MKKLDKLMKLFSIKMIITFYLIYKQNQEFKLKKIFFIQKDLQNKRILLRISLFMKLYPPSRTKFLKYKFNSCGIKLSFVF